MGQQSRLQNRQNKHLFLRRLAAFYIDGFVYTLPCALFFEIIGRLFPQAAESKALIVIVSLAGAFMMMLGRDLFDPGVGKRIMGIKVCSVGGDSGKVPALRLMFRNITLGLWPVEVIVMLSNGGAQRLGDKLCGTCVDLK